MMQIFLMKIRKYCLKSSQPGLEPGTFGLEVQRAIHCATGTLQDQYCHDANFFYENTQILFKIIN